MHACERCGRTESRYWNAIRAGLKCNKFICSACESDYIAVRDDINMDIANWIESERSMTSVKRH